MAAHDTSVTTDQSVGMFGDGWWKVWWVIGSLQTLVSHN